MMSSATQPPRPTATNRPALPGAPPAPTGVTGDPWNMGQPQGQPGFSAGGPDQMGASTPVNGGPVYGAGRQMMAPTAGPPRTGGPNDWHVADYGARPGAAWTPQSMTGAGSVSGMGAMNGYGNSGAPNGYGGGPGMQTAPISYAGAPTNGSSPGASGTMTNLGAQQGGMSGVGFQAPPAMQNASQIQPQAMAGAPQNPLQVKPGVVPAGPTSLMSAPVSQATRQQMMPRILRGYST